MKLEIYSEKPKEEEKVVKLRLKKVNSSQIILIAIDSSGQEWGILLIEKEGITRMKAVPTHLGFDLDSQGRIVFY